ncbi:uncharacterized protein HD556DRAFT_1359504 [Suillus plorans]|uniref:Uncharacterized protein n=1 Tax=Suillus plorans TaxID=116603 RepID=A0A9P7DJZ6_9AGAM|nr:uncharacterized protein HD556DRAFT_1359504 [Suillus plorans]KAG1796713.1 hypothetical protein HD556DRAFT_1359504 [Suillus plorans]
MSVPVSNFSFQMSSIVLVMSSIPCIGAVLFMLTKLADRSAVIVRKSNSVSCVVRDGVNSHEPVKVPRTMQHADPNK